MILVAATSSILPEVGTHVRAFLTHIGALGDSAIALAVVALIVYSVLRLASRRRTDLVELIAPYRLDQLAIASPEVDSTTVITLPTLRRVSMVLGQSVARTRIGRRIEVSLRRAGAPIGLGELFLVWLAGGVILVALGVLLGRLVGGLTALVLVLGVPPAALKIAISRRARSFAEQLPDVLKLTASSLRAGFSFAQSLDGVVRQIKKPAQTELQQVLSEVRLGKVLEDALADAAERIRNRDFSEAVMAVRIQQETGGNLAQLLDVLASTMTQRQRIRREIRTLTAEGRASAYVLGLMPLAIAAFLYSENRPYLLELVHTMPGRIALIGGAVLELLGFVWMVRIVKIEV